jgi:threonine dehydrogenase-like Zn-dependent dehydrogenase
MGMSIMRSIMKTKAIYFMGVKNAVIEEVDVPEPYHNEIQVKTIVNGICMFETWAYNTGAWSSKPYIPGHEGIGLVIKAGRSIDDVKEGDLVTTRKWMEVYNIPDGGYMKLSRKPRDVEKFMIEPSACSVIAAHYSSIFPGDRAILFGAGYMGLLLIQILRKYPLTELTAVDIKQENLKLALDFGATDVIDSSTEDGRRKLSELKKDSYDIAFDCSGAGEPLELCTRLVRYGGRIGIVAWHHEPRLLDTDAWHQKGLQILNLSPEIKNGEPLFKYFGAAEKLMNTGIINQDKLVTHRHLFTDISHAMDESIIRPAGFIKSVLVFFNNTL